MRHDAGRGNDAYVPDLAMKIPLVFACAFGVWFVVATAVLVAEAGLSSRIVNFRLLSPSRAAFRRTQAARLVRRQPEIYLQITRSLLRIAAFGFGLGVALPTLAQTINGSSLNISGQSTLQGDV